MPPVPDSFPIDIITSDATTVQRTFVEGGPESDYYTSTLSRFIFWLFDTKYYKKTMYSLGKYQ